MEGVAAAADAASEPELTVAEPVPAVRSSVRTFQEDQVRARRLRAEEERHAALRARQEERARRDAAAAESPVERVQAQLDALPAGRPHDATRAGLRKQLAAHKAAALREQRRKEQAEREAEREAERAELARQRASCAQQAPAPADVST
eukprot:2990203-Prymnesium_polylepis.1